MVAAAVVVAGSVVSAAATAYAANKSAEATEGAATTAAQEQQWALQQQEKMEQPYMNAGATALPQLENLLGLGKGGTAGIENTLANMPGFKFTQQQGNQATINAATASGMNLSGNTLQSLAQYNTGLANQYYGEYVGQLQNLVGTGQAAASNQAQATQQAATNEGNIAVNQGNNLANIDIGEAASLSDIASGEGNAYLEYQSNQNLLNSLNNSNNYDLSGAPRQ